jgi:hypothetical protein
MERLSGWRGDREGDLIDASSQRPKLSPMPNPRRVLVTVLASAAGAVAIMGCDRNRDAPRVDSVVSVEPALPSPDTAGRPVPSGWDLRAAGPVLLVAGDRPDAAVVVFPEVQGEHAAVELRLDTAVVRGMAATLVSRAGTTTGVTLGERTTPEEEEECVGWPMVRVDSPSGTVAPWAIGFVGSRLKPVPLDSVGSLSRADSAALVAEVARLASALPARAADPRLRGLPFFVQDARRFRVAQGLDAIVAQVIRRVHQEANPLEERTLLIAERDSARPPDRPGRYTLAFHERAVGDEETLEGSEVLAAFTHHATSRPMLVIARESESGVRYAILERSAPREWRVKWTSALVRC